MRDKLDDDKKEQLKESDKIRKKEIRDNLDDDKREQLKESDKKRKKGMHYNLDDDKREQVKESDKIRKKEICDNLDDDKTEQIRYNDKNRKKNQRMEIKDERKHVFDNVHGFSMFDSFILTTPAFKIIEEDFKSAIQEGPTSIYDICWKFGFRKDVIKLNALKYQTGICNKFSTGKSDWICRSCHKSILENKMPMQAKKNKIWLCPKFNEFESLCPIELMLISQIITFMFIFAKAKGAQHCLKGQCVLVPTDLKKR